MKLADCHPSRKHQARGLCKPCYDRWLKEQNPEYKERQLSNTTRWMRANPERAAAIQARRKAREQNNPAEHARVTRQRRNAQLRRTYGISLDDYEQMLSGQHGKCAICTREPGARPLHVDHCHTTNRVRGLLCHQCNWYLGTLEGGPGVFTRLINYLQEHESPALTPNN